MCDYSLQNVKTRPAKLGPASPPEKIRALRFIQGHKRARRTSCEKVLFAVDSVLTQSGRLLKWSSALLRRYIARNGLPLGSPCAGRRLPAAPVPNPSCP